MINKIEKQYVIGVDGGGTKTISALADLEGKILNIGKSGSSSPRNVGIEMTAANIAKGIGKVLPKDKKIKILSTFIGLPAVDEEFKSKKDKIKKELLKYKEISPIFQGKIIIGSDQIVDFCSGTEKKDGVLLIAGTGCVAHGWRGEKEAKASGWGWLADEGSAFWIGQRGFQTILKELDRRDRKTKITQLILKKIKNRASITELVKEAKVRKRMKFSFDYGSEGEEGDEENFVPQNIEEFLSKVYSKNPIKIISSFSILVDRACQGGDKIAKKILMEAGQELALAVNSVVEKLNFKKINFPLVLVGNIFQSKVVLKRVKREVKKFAPKAEFIQPKNEPVVGAIKLAIKQI